MKLLLCVVALSAMAAGREKKQCVPSITTVNGSHAPTTVCSGALIFADEFDTFDLEKWQHKKGASGHQEFQRYTNNRTNSFAHSGLLFIRPSVLADRFGNNIVTTGHLNIEGAAPAERCTNSEYESTVTPTNIFNMIKSARICTVNSFSFRYGKVDVRAKMPAGDWLWPAIWLMPTYSVYGTWPSSGEIDLVESRGNRDMHFNISSGIHIGTQEAGSTLHYGPYPELNGWKLAHWLGRNDSGYNTNFHRYQLEWTPDYIKFSIDDVEIGRVTPYTGGFWEHGEFNASDVENPWRYCSKMAPFDQKFYIIINLAVGGNSGYFPDDVSNPVPKPWRNGSPTAAEDFWNGQAGWLPTWKLDHNDGQDASLQVDYVRVWAL